MLIRRLPSSSILLLLRSTSSFTPINKLPGFSNAYVSATIHNTNTFSTLLNRSFLTQTNMAAVSTEEDPYTWLEEVESDESIAFAKAANGMFFYMKCFCNNFMCTSHAPKSKISHILCYSFV